MSAIRDEYGEFTAQVFARVWDLAKTRVSPELRDDALYHLATLEASKGMRPALVMAAARAAPGPLPVRALLVRGASVAMLHEATLIMDDVLDESPRRRGCESLFHRAGRVVATAVAAELATLAVELVDHDAPARELCRTLIREVCVAETLQERNRNAARPTHIELWMRIARGDTGAIFRLAMALGGCNCRALGDALAYLRHGLDDLEDLTEADADFADVRDGVPTLPSCFTSATTLEGLRGVIPECRDWLRGWLTRPARWPSFDPFFDDFAASLRG
jgi:geranylgeranyl pyrophosphate synthase